MKIVYTSSAQFLDALPYVTTYSKSVHESILEGDVINEYGSGNGGIIASVATLLQPLAEQASPVHVDTGSPSVVVCTSAVFIHGTHNGYPASIVAAYVTFIVSLHAGR